MSKSKSQPPVDSDVQQQLVQLARRALMSGVSVEELREHIAQQVAKLSVTSHIEEAQVQQRPALIKRRLPATVRLGALLVPMLLFGVGVYLIGSAVVPILGYYTDDTQRFTQTELITPIPRYQVMDVTPLVIMENAQDSLTLNDLENPNSIEVVSDALDYTNLTNWFSQQQVTELTERVADGPLQEYLVSIPTVNVEDARVAIGGTHLDESLIAYPGTALPGEYGAPVIFGHSVLRQFYNPSSKNPRRYNSIFSYIMTLKEGEDKIYVTADGVTYTYVVQQKAEVKPEDVYILTQQYDARRLKLVTCVPEGTYLRRGVVTAQLVETTAP